MTNHQQATLDGIAQLKAANERNNADMLDYINRMIWERKPWWDKVQGYLFKPVDKVLYEQAYQKACIKAKELGIL